MLELGSSVRQIEQPLDDRACAVATRFPSANFPLQHGGVGDPPVEALAGEHRQFDLRLVEPAGMIGRMDELQPFYQSPCLLGRERFIESRGRVRVEVVEHDADPLRVGKVHLDERLHLMREIDLRPLLGHLHMPPAARRVVRRVMEKEINHPVALVFVVVAFHLTRAHRQRVADLGHQLLGGLVEADPRPLRVGGFAIEVEHRFHPIDELRTHFRQTPAPLLPRLECVCFKSRRTVSSETASTSPNSTNRSASSCMVQQRRPSGGALQVSATRKASCLPSSLRLAPGRGFSESAASSPSSTKRFRSRSTEAVPVCRATAIWRSVLPSAASKRTCARRTLRAAAFPFWISASKGVRSCSDRSTRYSFMGVISPAAVYQKKPPIITTVAAY